MSADIFKPFGVNACCGSDVVVPAVFGGCLCIARRGRSQRSRTCELTRKMSPTRCHSAITTGDIQATYDCVDRENMICDHREPRIMAAMTINSSWLWIYCKSTPTSTSVPCCVSAQEQLHLPTKDTFTHCASVTRHIAIAMVRFAFSRHPQWSVFGSRARFLYRMIVAAWEGL